MTDVARTMPAGRLRVLAIDLFRAAGVSSDDAARAADILLTADLRGVSTHGVRLLPHNVRRLRGGAAKPCPDMRTVVALGAIEVLDGDFGLGLVTGSHAIERAVSLAGAHGIGGVLVRRSNHIAAAGSYAMIAVERGMLGIAMSNSSPSMAIEGAASRIIGNNPLAIGAPGPDFPILLDMAMSVVSGSRVSARRHAGQPVPPEWIVEKDGVQTALRTFGGPKGSGLAIMVEIVAGLLSGGGMLSDQNAGKGFSPETPDDCSQAYFAIDVRRLLPPAEYDARMRRLIGELKSAERAEGVAEIRLPGERAARESERRRREGVPLDAETVAGIEEIAAEIGVVVRWE